MPLVNPTTSSSGSSTDDSFELTNLGLAASVGSSALTVALKQKDGSDPASGTGAVKVGFRNSTLATGQYSQVSVTGSLSLVISSGSTLGTQNGVTAYLYVYLINNAGTAELAISQTQHEEGTVFSTVAEGGAGGATGRQSIYSTTARTNVAIRLIGRLKVNEATAGTWATAPSEISLAPFLSGQIISSGQNLRMEYIRVSCSGTTYTIQEKSSSWVTSVTRNGAGDISLNIAAGVWSARPCWTVTAIDSTNIDGTNDGSQSTTTIRFNMYNTAGSAGIDTGFYLIAIGIKSE